ncbi:MAG: DNA methyltransferase [Devosia sp.]
MNQHLDPSAILQNGFSAVAPARQLDQIADELFPADPPGLARQAWLLGEGKVSHLRDHPLTANHVAQGNGRTESGSRTQTDKAFAELIAAMAKTRGRAFGRSVTFQRLRWYEQIDPDVLLAVEGSPFETVACLDRLAKDGDAERQRRLLASWQKPVAGPEPVVGRTWCGDRVPGIVDNPTRFFVPDVFGTDGKLLVPSVDFRRGDSCKIMPTLDRASFDLIATDPPYGIDRKDSEGRTIIGDEKDSKTVHWAVPLSMALLRDDRYAYYAAAAAVRPRWAWMTETLKFGYVEELIWNKGQGSALGKADASFNLQTERFLIVHKGNPKLRPHTVDGRLVQRDSDLWSIPSPRRAGFGDKHPSRKPPELFERVYANASDEGDAVLDPFAGCAPSGVAAIRMRRRWLGIEKERDWFDGGVRWLKHDLAAKYPEHLSSAR